MRLLHVAQGHLAVPHRRGPRRGTRCHRAPSGRRVRPAARRARRAELRRHPRRAGRDADVGAGARERAVSAGLDRGRSDRRRLRGHRRDHRSQVAVAARALDRRGRARRGRRLAHGPAGRRRHAPAARRARARPRPGRRVERDLGEAGTARVRGVGAGATAPALHRARLRPVAGARPDRDRWPAHTTSGSTGPATTAAPAGRRSIKPPASSPPRTATRPCARRGRTGRRSMRRRRRRSCCARPKEGRLDPEAVDAVLAAAGHRVREATARAARRPDRARAGGAPRARARRVEPGRSPTDLGISAKTVGHHVQHIYQKAGVRSRAAATVWAFEHDLVHSRHRAFARCRPARRGADTRFTIGVEPRRREHTRRTQMILATTTVEDFDRFEKIFSTKGAEKRQAARVQGRDRSSAIRTRTTASGCSSTGMRRAGRASPPTPRSRRSCRKPGTRAGPRSAELGGRYDA